MRYEPWVFGRRFAASLGETIFQGRDEETPWSPDVLIEFMKPAGRDAFMLEYAVVVDAKYVRHLRDNHWEQCRKYMQIRSVESGEAIVKQVWLAKPSVEGISLDDPGLVWTDTGPSARRNETFMGQLGLLPAGRQFDVDEDQRATATALEFVRGLLSYLGFDIYGGNLTRT